MKNAVLCSVAVALIIAGGSACAWVSSSGPARYVPVTEYDPARDAEKDINAAVAEAARTDKQVLVEVGGKWCGWCRTMDNFFKEHPDLLAFREQNYVMVKVNVSPENKNEKALSRYPRIPGYPHIFVLDRTGRLLQSEDTSQLEDGRSYNLEKFFAFLKKWAPPSASRQAGN